MSLRRKILIAFIIIVGVGFAGFTWWAKGEIRDINARLVEDLLVDISQLMAADLSHDFATARPHDYASRFSVIVDEYRHTRFRARILGRPKTDPSLDFYVTNADGIVIYSSRDANEVGRDYSTWNDVARTLHGEYGARATRVTKNDEGSSVYYVAAPILLSGKIAGVVTVIKPRLSVSALLQNALNEIAIGAFLAFFAITIFGAILVVLITRPIEALRNYALAISEGHAANLPSLPHRELRSLADAFEKMRITLEGKKSIESFTQSLTHELKSPLTVIRGGAELCLEDMPPDQRRRFLTNIINESARAQSILEQLLEVAALESRTEPAHAAPVPLEACVASAVESLAPLAAANAVTFTVSAIALVVTGDEFLLTQAIRNVLQNAIEFSPRNSTVEISQLAHTLSIRDHGTGIPPYAQARLFEKFFSLERPTTGKKGTGLGLNFVREVMHLHKGSVAVESGDGGTDVRLKF